jgi:hypothetical protein
VDNIADAQIDLGVVIEAGQPELVDLAFLLAGAGE